MRPRRRSSATKSSGCSAAQGDSITGPFAGGSAWIGLDQPCAFSSEDPAYPVARHQATSDHRLRRPASDPRGQSAVFECAPAWEKAREDCRNTQAHPGRARASHELATTRRRCQDARDEVPCIPALCHPSRRCSLRQRVGAKLCRKRQLGCATGGLDQEDRRAEHEDRRPLATDLEAGTATLDHPSRDHDRRIDSGGDRWHSSRERAPRVEMRIS